MKTKVMLVLFIGLFAFVNLSLAAETSKCFTAYNSMKFNTNLQTIQTEYPNGVLDEVKNDKVYIAMSYSVKGELEGRAVEVSYVFNKAKELISSRIVTNFETNKGYEEFYNKVEKSLTKSYGKPALTDKKAKTIKNSSSYWKTVYKDTCGNEIMLLALWTNKGITIQLDNYSKALLENTNK